MELVYEAMEDKDYLEYCRKNNLDSSLVRSFDEYQNELMYQAYMSRVEIEEQLNAKD